MAAGAFSLAVAVTSPLRGRLVDDRGARRAFPPMAVISATALLVDAVLAGAGSGGLLVALAAVAGATTPPLVAAMRLEWQRLLGSSDRRLAYAFESSALAQGQGGREWPDHHGQPIDQAILVVVQEVQP